MASTEEEDLLNFDDLDDFDNPEAAAERMMLSSEFVYSMGSIRNCLT